MADIFDTVKRSEVMSKIKSKNGKAETLAFKYLRANKVYFQKHYQKIEGTPDIALPRRKLAVFIDGDFWHGSTIERLIERRGPNDKYWVPKIKRNMERDRLQEIILLSKGWFILRIWEKDIVRKSTFEDTMNLIIDFLKTQR